MPALSIVIPAYNMAGWLPAALESCLWQTHKDLEILVIDDGSSDNGLEIAEAYSRIDSRIIAISQPNAGSGAARLRGQSEATGDYITWLDADDFLDPSAAAIWLDCAERDKDDMVCGNAVAFSNRTFNARRYFPHPPALGLTFDNAPAYWKSKVMWRWVFSLPFLRTQDIGHTGYALGQDVCFMYETLIRAQRFAQVREVVYYFRQEHKSSYAAMHIRVEHAFAHYLEVKNILLRPPDGRPRIKPFVKYLNENYWRDIQKTAPRLSGPDKKWEARIIELGFSLFEGLDPAWFRQAALAPGLREQTAFLPLVDALAAGDADAARAIFAELQARPPKAPDKKNAFHTIRHKIKSAFNPLAWSARSKLRRLEASAARRSGVPPARAKVSPAEDAE